MLLNNIKKITDGDNKEIDNIKLSDGTVLWKRPALEAYANLTGTGTNKTLTFYYDRERNYRVGTKYNIPETKTYPGWLIEKSNIASMIFDSSFKNYKVKSMFSWCYGFDNPLFTSWSDQENIDTSKCTTMQGLFKNCSSLLEITFSNNFVPSETLSMSEMFYCCTVLNTINFSNNFDTSKCTDMSYMFYGCAVKNGSAFVLPNGFNTSEVTDIKYMFALTKFTYLDFSNSIFNVEKVTDMTCTFSSMMINIFDLPPDFNPKNCLTMSDMFAGSSVKFLETESCLEFDTSKVINFGGMFFGCSNLNSIIFPPGFSFKSTEHFDNFFLSCTSLYRVDFGDAVTMDKNTASTIGFFANCPKLNAVSFNSSCNFSALTGSHLQTFGKGYTTGEYPQYLRGGEGAYWTSTDIDSKAAFRTDASETSSVRGLMSGPSSSLKTMEQLKKHHSEYISESATYVIVNKKDNSKVLYLPGSSTSVETQVKIYDRNDADNQKWKFDLHGLFSDYLLIKPYLKTTRCIRIPNGYMHNSNKLDIYDIDPAYYYYWILIPTSGSYYKICSAMNLDKVFDVENGQMINDQPVQLYKWSETDSQQWKFVEVT